MKSKLNEDVEIENFGKKHNEDKWKSSINVLYMFCLVCLFSELI